MRDRQAEIRPITALFLDVVGSTDLQAMVGAERLKRTLDRAFAELSDIMTSEGGTIEKYTGDGVFAIFGAPRAHGDDPLRALRAAEASLSWANRNRDGQLQVGIRIGVETGDAVVDVHRTDVEHQQMVVGSCVNAAARLQAIADPGTVLVGSGCREAAITSATFHDLGERDLKGLGVQRIWRLGSVTPRSAGSDIPFVGRDAELKALQHALRRAHERPEVVVVSGPPGQGKTRLVEEFLRRIESTVELLVARCRPFGESGAPNPLRQLLLSAGGDDLAGIRQRCEELTDEPISASRIAKALAHSAGVRASSDLAGMHAAERDEEVARGWRSFLSALSRARPVVIWIEDLHWAEPEFMGLLQRVVGNGHDALLVLGTARPEFSVQDGALPRGQARTIDIGPLSQEQADILTRLVTTGAAPPTARAAGNPLFIIELARSQNAVGDTLPTTLRNVIGARLDELRASDRELLQATSVAGEAFSIADAAVLAGQDRTTTSVALERIADQRYLLRTSVGYRFHHALLHEAAYQRLPVAQRMGLHARYAREGVTRGDPEAAAYHWWEALKPPNADWVWESSADLKVMRRAAFDVLVAAGAQQHERSALSAAVSTLQHALELAATPLEGATAHAELAKAYRAQIMGDEAWKHYIAACTGFRESGEEPRAELYAAMVEMPANWPLSFRSPPPSAEVSRYLDEAESAARSQKANVAQVRILLARLRSRTAADATVDHIDELTEAQRLLAGHEEDPSAIDAIESLGGAFWAAGDAITAGQMYARVDDLLARGARLSSSDDYFQDRIDQSLWSHASPANANSIADLYEAAAGDNPHLLSHALGARSWIKFTEGDFAAVLHLEQTMVDLVEKSPKTLFCLTGAGSVFMNACHAHALLGQLESAERALARATQFAGGSKEFKTLYCALLRRGIERDVLLDNATIWTMQGEIAITAAAVAGRWDLIDNWGPALRERYARGMRLSAAVVSAAIEEREHARGGPLPAHRDLRAAGASGWSQTLARARAGKTG